MSNKYNSLNAIWCILLSTECIQSQHWSPRWEILLEKAWGDPDANGCKYLAQKTPSNVINNNEVSRRGRFVPLPLGNTIHHYELDNKICQKPERHRMCCFQTSRSTATFDKMIISISKIICNTWLVSSNRGTVFIVILQGWKTVGKVRRSRVRWANPWQTMQRRHWTDDPSRESLLSKSQKYQRNTQGITGWPRYSNKSETAKLKTVHQKRRTTTATFYELQFKWFLRIACRQCKATNPTYVSVT